MKILITVRAGFICSDVIRHIFNNAKDCVINVDKVTNAGHPGSFLKIQTNPRYHFTCDAVFLHKVIIDYSPDIVMHLAAESHVARSEDDHVRALYTVLTQGNRGQTYSVCGICKKKNIKVVSTLCEQLELLIPYILNSLASDSKRGFKNLVRILVDRTSHALLFAVDSKKINSELNWSPKEIFESGIRKTVKWYLNNTDSVDNIYSDKNHGKLCEK